MDSDALVRSAAENNAAAARDVTHLIDVPEPDLYSMLAVMALRPEKAFGSSESRFRPLVDGDDFKKSTAELAIGKRVFRRWSRATHDFVCSSDAEDKELKDRMLAAIFSKDGGGIAVVSGGLVALFGLSPAVAAVVSALLIKLVVAPAMDEICKAWSSTLVDAAGR